MNHQADSFFLPINAQSRRASDAVLFGVNADGINKEQTDFACLGSRKNKSLNHSNLVTAVTDGNDLTLLMFSHSASSIFEFAIGSSSGEIQVDSARVSTELTFLEEARVKNSVSVESGSPTPGRIVNEYFPAVSSAASTTS
jgi:hypothetical protein